MRVKLRVSPPHTRKEIFFRFPDPKPGKRARAHFGKTHRLNLDLEPLWVEVVDVDPVVEAAEMAEVGPRFGSVLK